MVTEASLPPPTKRKIQDADPIQAIEKRVENLERLEAKMNEFMNHINIQIQAVLGQFRNRPRNAKG